MKIITINRQFGSGGREVGKRLAEALNIAFYDKELLNMIAEETKMHPDFIDKFDEVNVMNFNFSFGRSFYTYQQSPTEQVQIAQGNIIKQIADKESAVIMGRCASHILKDSNPFKIFIYSSDMDLRVKRCFAKDPNDKKSEKDMIKEINKIDKQRAKYFEYYTNEKWLDISQYNLCIDTAKVDIKTAVSMIVSAINNN